MEDLVFLPGAFIHQLDVLLERHVSNLEKFHQGMKKFELSNY
jgi:hypothetical protein